MLRLSPQAASWSVFKRVSAKLARVIRWCRSVARLTAMGPVTAAVWGASVIGLAPNKLRMRRAAVATSIDGDSMGRSTNMTLAMHQPSLDPAFAVFKGPFVAWGKMIYRKAVPNHVLQLALISAAKRLQGPKGRAKWSAVTTVATTLLAYAAEIGWTIKKLLHFRRQRWGTA